MENFAPESVATFVAESWRTIERYIHGLFCNPGFIWVEPTALNDLLLPSEQPIEVPACGRLRQAGVVTNWVEATPLNLSVWSRQKVGEPLFPMITKYYFPDYSRAVGSTNFINAGFQSGADNANKA